MADARAVACRLAVATAAFAAWRRLVIPARLKQQRLAAGLLLHAGRTARSAWVSWRIYLTQQQWKHRQKVRHLL